MREAGLSLRLHPATNHHPLPHRRHHHHHAGPSHPLHTHGPVSGGHGGGGKMVVRGGGGGMQSCADVRSAAHGVRSCGQPLRQTRVRQHLLTIVYLTGGQVCLMFTGVGGGAAGGWG